MMRRKAAILLAGILASVTLAAETPSALWIDVPFVAQPREGCGAASLSMVMQYWAQQQHSAADSASDVAAIQRQIFSPKQHGATPAAMENYLKQNGFQAFAFSGTWNDLVEQISKGRPLIVALRPRSQAELHYVVIDGVDTTDATVTMNDPADRKLLTEERAGFEKGWSATRNWTLLAVPVTNRTRTTN